MVKKNKKQEPERIQLEIPNYSQEYEEWLKKQQNNKQQTDTVLIIDLF